MTDKNLIIRIKDLWKQDKTEFVTQVITLILIILAIYIAIMEALHYDVSKYVHPLILGMIAFLCLHFILERLKTITEMKELLKDNSGSLAKITDSLELEKSTGVDMLDKNFRGSLIKALKNYVDVRNLQSTAQESNPEFGRIVNRFLRDQNKVLEDLAESRLDVSHERKAFTYGVMADVFETRFDAVSYKDLEFWNSNDFEDEAYFEICRQQATLGKTIVTRIFVLDYSKCFTPIVSEDLIYTLERQFKANIGWAVSIDEEFPQPLKNKLNHSENLDIKPDFAVFDSGKAIARFTTSDPRTFEMIFQTGTKESQKIIDAQKNLYADFLGNCWVMNSIFKENSGLKECLRKESIKNAYENRKKRIEKTVEGPTFEPGELAIVVDSPEKIRTKLEHFKKVMDEYHTKTGRTRNVRRPGHTKKK